MNKPPQVSDNTPMFRGQFSDIDQGDVPEGCMYRQVNMLSVTNGQLTTRGGLKEITLDTLE